MPVHDAGRIVLDLAQCNKSLSFEVYSSTGSPESLGISVNRGLRVLQKYALRCPLGKEVCGASIGIVLQPITGIPLAEDNSYEVVRIGSVVAVLHLGCNLVVGLGSDLGQRNPSRIIAKRAEWCDMGHEQGIKRLYQVARPHPEELQRTGGQTEHLPADLEQTFAQGENQSFVVERIVDARDKDLTSPLAACANICSQFVDPMTRQHQRGSSRPGTAIRNMAKNQPRHAPSMFRFLAPLITLASCLLFCSVGLAQAPDVEDVHIAPRLDTDNPSKISEQNVLADTVQTHAPTIKSKVDLVLVPVTVTDPMNRLVTGLDKENFAVFEGKDKQEVRHFSAEDAPISLGVIFDMSGSMSSKIERAREAVIEFFKTANPEDEFFLITFSDKPEEVSDFTQSVDDLQGKL